MFGILPRFVRKYASTLYFPEVWKEHGGNEILVVIIILDQQATERLGV